MTSQLYKLGVAKRKEMEERKISEQESLALITQMIQQTKHRLNIGSGNVFLVWGYVCVGVSLAIYLLQASRMMEASASWLYYLIPILGFILTRLVNKGREVDHVKNYTTCIIDAVWMIVSITFGIAFLVFLYFLLVHHKGNAIIFFFLGFLLPGMGVAVTGTALREKSVTIGGFLGMLFGIAAMEAFVINAQLTVDWHLAFAAVYAVMMVMPGHYLNNKARKQ